jgi:hypothetical protein
MSEMTDTPPALPTPPKQRHGCLTAYLVFMIIANSGTALLYLTSSDAIQKNMPNMPGWAFPALIAAGFFNLVCAIALFRWKKWGFWGFVGSAAVTLGVNIAAGLSPGSALGGFVGIAILYGVLQIGDENKGWPQLE